ncbi:sugar ABC transporter ATP-binding protein [Streptomyces sp. UNOC14_S4]|nr:sugar ABC transporter ATP-binding protein [Streptomyces sp. UNOC14_S4]MCC3770012.1 sugar ABC transporter ATP-binding protein [Streptomyces sp. UNOC14_S4]
MRPSSSSPVHSAAPPRPVAEADGVSRRFGATVALRSADIAVLPGEAHALVGRNGAGKSTLVGLLTGLLRPDAGVVRFDGGPAPAFGDTRAWRSRVACVHQRSTILPELTVAENLFLDRQSASALRPIRWKRLRARAAELLGEYGVDVDPALRARDLSVGQRQFVEIARALSSGARFVVLDEPTAKLDARGIDLLFAKLRALRGQGVAFLYISHHLREVYALCDTVTVFRDARRVVTAPVSELGHRDLVEAMTGEQPSAPEGRTSRAVPPRDGDAPVLLSVEGLTLPGGVCRDVSFAVRAGEAVGLAGSAASGNAQVGEAVAGLRKAAAGRIAVAGRPVRTGSVPHALAAGIGLVPEDRHAQGLVPARGVGEHVTLSAGRRLGPFGTVLPSRARALADRMIEELDIKAPGSATPVAALSGGNQQKVVVARALAAEPRVLVTIRPANGVDVRSKEFLLGRVRRVADEGRAVLVVSDELDDLRMCDRTLVMCHGRLTGAFGRGWSDRDMVAAMEDVPGAPGPSEEPGSEGTAPREPGPGEEAGDGVRR